MHGTIFVELKKYVEAKLGNQAWARLIEAAGLRDREYSAFGHYPDEDAGRLVRTASTITGQEPTAILEDFGAFIAPDLLEMYWGLVAPEWRTLDVIEHTESAIHDVVRLERPGASPPRLKVTRAGPDEVSIRYDSERRMCPVAVGIAKGLARHFGETIQVDQPSCMLRGDDSCDIRVRRVEVP